ncbi:MAG: N-acetyltransferase family protein [Pseudomonadota bacterium]
MTLRAAVPEDAERVTALWNAMITQTLSTFTTIPRNIDEVGEVITTRSPAFLVLEIAGRVEGFATYGPFRPGPGYAHTVEHSVLLSEEAQGRGQGRALMAALEDVARAQEMHVLIGAVSSANPGAVAFHERLGFTQIGRLPEVGRKAGQWLDLILMQKLL